VHYIENIDEINEQYGEKLKMAEVTPLDIKPDEIEQVKKEIRDIKERLRRIDLKMEDLEDGDLLERLMKSQLQDQLGPVMERLNSLVDEL
jgi:hypothetical protein